MTAIQRTTLKHPGSAYLIVAFVALCMTAVVRSSLEALVYLIPAAGALYVARTATIVDERGLTARAIFGSQTVGWDELRGLRLAESGAVFAVDTNQTQLKLPCIRSTKLEPLIAAGGGRIPDPQQAVAAPEPVRSAEPAEPAEPVSEGDSVKTVAPVETVDSPAAAETPPVPETAESAERRVQ